MAKIKSIGIQDVELMFDKQIGIWAVCQVFKPSGKILLLDESQSRETIPTIMFWIKTSDGHYRTPSEQDLSDIVAIVQRSEVTLDKGNDWMVDNIEAKEKVDHASNRKAQSDRIRSFAPQLKRAIKRELL